jgi:hypothetical protein
MKLNYFPEVSLFFNTIPLYPDPTYLVIFYNCYKTPEPHESTSDVPMCHLYSQDRCCYLLWLECSQLLPVFFVTCTTKLTFTPIRAKGFMCLSVTLGSRQYTLHLSISYSFSMSSHSVVLVSHSPFAVNWHPPICYIMSQEKVVGTYEACPDSKDTWRVGRQ